MSDQNDQRLVLWSSRQYATCGHIYIYACMTLLIWISKHVFDFVFGTRFCLIFRELFCSCAKKLGKSRVLVVHSRAAVVRVQLSEPSEDGVLCFAAGGSAGRSPTSSAGCARGCHA